VKGWTRPIRYRPPDRGKRYFRYDPLGTDLYREFDGIGVGIITLMGILVKTGGKEAMMRPFGCGP